MYFVSEEKHCLSVFRAVFICAGIQLRSRTRCLAAIMFVVSLTLEVSDVLCVQADGNITVLNTRTSFRKDLGDELAG